MPEKDHSSTVSLEGSYKLVAFTRKVVDTGEVYDTSGKEPGGYINYTRDGRMLVLMVSDKTKDQRPKNSLPCPTNRPRACSERWWHMAAPTSLTVTRSSIILTFRGIRHGLAPRKSATCRKTATSSSTPPARFLPRRMAR